MVTFFATDPAVAQGVAAYNKGLTEADIARVNAAVQEAAIRAQAQQAAQNQYFRQQEMAQQNDLQRQQLANQDFYNRGRLQNEAAQVAAQQKAYDAQIAAANNERFWKSSENALDRAANEKLYGVRYPHDIDPRVAQLGAQENEIADSAKNLAVLRNQHTALTKQLEDVTNAEIMAAQSPNKLTMAASAIGPLGVGGALLNRYFQNQSIDRAARGAVPYDVPLADTDTATAIKQAKDALTAKKADLEARIRHFEDQGIGQHVGQLPTGEFVPTFKPTVTLNTSTNGLGRFFNPQTGTVTNPPPAEAQVILLDAQDAIRKGADPAAVAQRLRERWGLELPR